MREQIFLTRITKLLNIRHRILCEEPGTGVSDARYVAAAVNAGGTGRASSTSKGRRWIYFWALLGLIALVLQINAYGRWILSSDFRPTVIGPDPIPEYSRIATMAFQWLSIITLLFVLPWFVRGIRQQRRIDATRLMMIGWLSAYWLDPFLNFLTPMFTYNASVVNFGCWCEFIPGWQSYNGRRIAEPLLIDGPAYFYTFTGTALMGLWAMRKAQSRWPRIGTKGLMLCAYPAIWIGMGVLDVVSTRYMHFDAWPGSLQSAALWGGQFYPCL